jgi:hypothetical protein
MSPQSATVGGTAFRRQLGEKTVPHQLLRSYFMTKKTSDKKGNESQYDYGKKEAANPKVRGINPAGRSTKKK